MRESERERWCVQVLESVQAWRHGSEGSHKDTTVRTGDSSDGVNLSYTHPP